MSDEDIKGLGRLNKDLSNLQNDLTKVMGKLQNMADRSENLSEKYDQLREDIQKLEVRIDMINLSIEKLKDDVNDEYVSKESNEPIRLIVYGIAGTVLLAVLWAILGHLLSYGPGINVPQTPPN